MAVDPRQVLAGFLTISMFVLLGNMIKQDHFDSVEVHFLETKIATFLVFVGLRSKTLFFFFFRSFCCCSITSRFVVESHMKKVNRLFECCGI